MNPNFGKGCDILIVTSGIFLQKLIHERNLDEYTHIILDEVHERDIDIDFVMLLIKHILYNNFKIKLVLMSATIATTLFANYFSKSSIRHLKEGDYFKEFSDETNPMNKKYTSGWGVENKFKKLETGISEIEGQWKNEEEIKEKIKE